MISANSARIEQWRRWREFIKEDPLRFRIVKIAETNVGFFCVFQSKIADDTWETIDEQPSVWEMNENYADY